MIVRCSECCAFSYESKSVVRFSYERRECHFTAILCVGKTYFFMWNRLCYNATRLFLKAFCIRNHNLDESDKVKCVSQLMKMRYTSKC
jgi:hypothetical protein